MKFIDKFIISCCEWFLHFFKNESTREKLAKLFNLEVITYIIAGILTTLVNWLVSFVFNDLCHISISWLVTSIAWFVSVAFAYWINNSWVFRAGREEFSKELEKIWKFFLSRAATGVIEIGGMYMLVDIIALPFWPVKILISVAVIILNYIFSKIFVFIKNSSK